MSTGRVPILAFTKVLIPIKNLALRHAQRKKNGEATLSLGELPNLLDC